VSFTKFKSDNSKFTETPVYSKLITSILHMTVPSYYNRSSLLFVVCVIYKFIFSTAQDFLELLVYQKYTRQWAVPNMTCCIVMELSVLGFRELLNPLQVCSWLFLAPIKNFLSWCLYFLLYLRNKSITNEKIYRKYSSINMISKRIAKNTSNCLFSFEYSMKTLFSFLKVVLLCHLRQCIIPGLSTTLTLVDQYMSIHKLSVPFLLFTHTHTHTHTHRNMYKLLHITQFASDSV
jgi:hypothetical protein